MPSLRIRFHSGLALLLFLSLAVPGCMTNTKVNKANYDQIKPGMTRADVEAILGPGDSDSGLDTSEGSGVAGAIGVTTLSAGGSGGSSIKYFKWGNDTKYIRIGFQGDRVVQGRIEQQGL
jgi:hypothetical protein